MAARVSYIVGLWAVACVVPDADDDDGPDDGDCRGADDADCDGVPTDEDCDDEDAAMPSDDADCDGVPTDEDCDDADATMPTGDADCDGTSTAADCDDDDPLSTVVANDGDCDGTITVNDCDDDDPESTTVFDDSDCDGLLNDLTAMGGMVLRTLPAGTFQMGCTGDDPGCRQESRPAHAVTLTRDFWIGETEVTQQQWQSVIGNNPAGFTGCGTDCPIETVNGFEAAAYANALSQAAGLPECYSLTGCEDAPGEDMWCASLTVARGSIYECEGYRLPTEAEWEYAARAGTDFVFAGSDSVVDVGWFTGNSDHTVHPVASAQANAWGLYDMSGNVNEIVSDWYGEEYYSVSPAIDPAGLEEGDKLSMRGGNWDNLSDRLHVYRRKSVNPGALGDSLGFRIARTVPGPSE